MRVHLRRHMSTTAATSRSPVLVATDLTEHAEPALVHARALASAVNAPLHVMHVVPDVLRHHPLVPSRDENDATLALELSKQAADLVTQQVGRALRIGVDAYRVRVELGDAEDEIARVAEEEHAQIVVVGAKPRHGTERVLGHVAERVVRYAHTSVVVARSAQPIRTVLVTTDFTEGATPALRFARTLVETTGAEATLLHVMQLPAARGLVSALSALGNPWMPPPAQTIERLESLGLAMLESLAQQHHLQRVEQIEGDPGSGIMNRAEALGADLIVMGSHGRTGLRRLVLGSVAEAVIRSSTRSVMVARPA